MPNTSAFRPSQPIAYGKQTLDDQDIQAVVDVLKSPYLTQGPAIAAFEKAVASYCQVGYAVAFSSGTAALHAAYHVIGLGPGDEAITSPITFAASSNAMAYVGATPVFADIDPNTWNLSLDAVKQKLTSKTKALVPVHFAGLPVDLEAYYAFADQHNLVVIEDAAHALGAHYQGHPVGQCRDMGILSFHPVKSITTGEGGMVVTPHRHYYEALLQFRTHGITKNTEQFKVFSGAPWEYEMQELGYNYRMTDIQAALGLSQLSKLDDFIARRQIIVDRYRQAFADLPAVSMQAQPTDRQSAHHLFILTLNDSAPLERRALFEALWAQNIRPQVHYIPVHLQPYYQEQYGYGTGDFPIAEDYYSRCISLPIYPTLTDEEQQYIIDCIKSHLS